jgi:2-polyprenyl-3-methyl-5-hydroxy-6-metoxy-1,4-benzoquinol methylase
LIDYDHSANRHTVQGATAALLEECFDIIIAEQVFEHLLWPYRAARNLFQMLTKNGALLITTPFLIKIHNEPVGCCRWTETGLRYFLGEAGFNVDRIITGSWGNRGCIHSNWKNWTIYRLGCTL